MTQDIVSVWTRDGFIASNVTVVSSCLQVDENGKIHRLRRECPADECGAGVFMASHFDRHYCGKCCLTYCFNKREDK